MAGQRSRKAPPRLAVAVEVEYFIRMRVAMITSGVVAGLVLTGSAVGASPQMPPQCSAAAT